MKHLLRNLALVALLCVPWVTQAQNTLTVAAGSATNTQVPVHGNWADAYLRCQTIYPASMIEEAATSVFMETGSITGLTYYLSTPASAAWTGTFEVKMKETSEETLSAFADVTDATTVYTGSLDGTSSTMVIAFTTPYTYSGGNLLIEISQTTKGNYKSCTFSGVSSTSASWQGYNSTALASITGSTQGFIPKTTFSFTGGIELTCLPVTEVSVSDITSTAATINWSSANDATATYTIKNGAAEVATTAAGATSYTLTGLSANTTYSTFTVTANCGGDDHSAAVSVPSFYTGYCNPAPSSVDGSGITAVAFGAGSYLVNNTTRPTSSPYYGNYSAQIGAAIQGETANVNITFATGYTYGTVIWIDWNNNLTFEDSEIVYAGEAADDNPTTLSASFSVAAGQALGDYRMRIAASDSYYDSHKTMATAAGADPCPSSSYTVVHDYTVRVIPAPTCYKPTAAEATNLATDGATISWTRDARNAAGETYTIMNGTTELGTTAAGATSFNVTGLTANTEYTLTIVTNCAADDESVDNVQVTFTTLANCATPVLTAGGVTNIAAHTADVAWTGYASNNSYVVSVGVLEPVVVASYDFEDNIISGNFTSTMSNAWSATAADKHAGTYAAKSGNGGVASSTSDMVLEVNLTSEATLTFWAKVSSESSWDKGYFSIDGVAQSDLNGISGSGSWLSYSYVLGVGTHTLRWYYTKDGSGDSGDDCLYVDDIAITGEAVSMWTNHNAAAASISLTGLESETRYAVKVKGLCDGGVESDESAVVSFTTLEGCMVPTALAVAPENITTTTAVVGWTNGYSTDDAWEINYRVSGAAEWTVVNATTNPHTLTGLAANTAYEVRMRTYCGTEGYSDWSATVSFRTACGVVSTYPWMDNFDSYSGTVSGTTNNLPSCWSYINTCTYNSYKGYPVVYNGSSYSRSGNNHLRFYSYYSSYTAYDPQNQYAILPQMSGLAGKQITMWIKGYNASSTVKVGLMSDPADAATFVELEEQYGRTMSTSYQEFLYLVPGDATAGYVAVMIEAASSSRTTNSVYIDDITIEEAPACRTPQSIAFSNVERLGFTATWEAHPLATANDYQVVASTTALDAAGLAAAEKTAVNGATTYTFTGMERETEYHVYVRANCGGDVYSDWISGTVTTQGLGADCTMSSDGNVATGDGNIQYMPWGDFYKSYYTQQIYTAAELTAAGLSAGYISKVAFQYALSSSYTKTVTLYMGTTSDNSFATTSFKTVSEVKGATSVTFNAAQWYEFELDVPFYWDGTSNVIVGGKYMGTNYPSNGTATFVGGTTADNMAIYSRADSGEPSTTTGTTTNKRANIVFTMCPPAVPCPAVTAVEVTDITETEATLTWEAVTTADYLSGYQVLVTSTELDAATLAAYDGPYTYEGTATTYDATGLTAYTMYYVYVRANCQAGGHDDGSSQWLSYSFRTMSQCGAVTNISVVQTGKSTATATWEKTKPAQTNNFNYILSTTGGLADATLNAMPKTGTGLAEATASLAGLSPATTYYLYVQNNCGGEGASPWVSQSFTTYDALPAVVNIATTEVTHTAIAYTWERNTAQFADETQWQVAVVAHGETPASWTTVSAMHYTAVGLTPETSYDLYVRPYQASPEAYGSDSHLDEVTTTAMPAACELVADGTTTNSNLPIYGNYMDDPVGHQSIYPAEMLTGLVGKTITGLHYFVSSGNGNSWTDTKPMTVKMKVVENTTLSSFLNVDDATTVYDGVLVGSQVNATNGFDIVFTNSFTYTGGNLLIALQANPDDVGGYNSVYFFGVSATNASRYGSGSSNYNFTGSGTSQSFLPKVQFCYEQGTCVDMTNVTVSDVTTNSAAISWMPGNAETSWQYVFSAGETESSALEAAAVTTTATEYLPTGLTPDVDYYFYIRPVCGVDEYGNWTMRQFTTVATCGKPTVLAATEVTTTTATLNALAHPTIGTASTYTFRYWKDGDEENKTVVPAQAASSAAIGSLLPNTTYWFDVMVSCTGAAGDSRWSEPFSFTTPCAAVTEFPWNEDFESYAAGNLVDNCWMNEHISGSGSNIFKVYTGNNGTNSTHQLQLPDQSSGTLTKLVLPQMTIPASDYLFVLDVYRTSNYSNYTEEGVRVFLSTDGEIEGSTELAFIPRVHSVESGIIPAEATAGWYTYKLPLGISGTYYIILRGENKYGASTYMDNFVVRQMEKYTVNISVTMTDEETPAPMGSVASSPATLANQYEDTPVSLTATANYGYHFTNWSESDVVLTTDNPYEFALESDRDIKANYDSNQYTITAAMVAQQESEGWGTVSGTATVNFNLPVTLTATPAVGYHFVNWTNSAYAVSGTEATLTVNAYRDSTFTAHFDTNVYVITVNAVGSEMGTAEGPATLKHFLSADYVAAPNYGYHFVNWTDGEDNVLGSETTLAGFSPVANTTLNANFGYNTYTITAATANAVMGSVGGTATVDYLQNVTLTAAANYGYHFVNWTAANGEVLGTTESITVQALRDSVITANFDYNQYTVTVASANATMGGVSGTTTQNYLTEVQIAATPNYGYHFTQWNDGNTDNPRTVVVTANATYTASFDYNQYTVSGVCDEVMGSVSGTQTVNYLQNVTLTATANYGYHFVNWTNAAGTVLGTGTSVTVQALRDSVITANFDYNQYTVTAQTANATMGSATGTQTVNYLTPVTLTAAANYGYTFAGWYEADTLYSNELVIAVPALSDRTLTATYTVNQYTVTVVSADEVMGSASGTATEDYLTNITITATANPGYHFVRWNDNNTANPRVVSVTENATYTAYFTYNAYTVTVSSASTTMGTVAPATSTVNYLSSVAISATPKTGYHFTQWNDGNTDNPRTVTVSEPGDLSFTASFDTNVYTVSTAVNDEAMGSVSEGGSVKHFKSIALVATPNYGYHFVNWTDANGTAKGNAATLNVSPVSDTALTANFTYNQYTVTGLSASATMGTVEGTATVNYLTDVTLTATANYGYHFTGWSNGATTESITIQATKDTTVTALFDYNQYTVTGLSADETKGTVSGTATVNYLTDVVLTATAATGYHFVQWNDGNTDNPRTVSATEDMSFTATFAINLYNITLAYNAERGAVTNDDASDATVAAGYVFENVEHGSTLHLTAEVFEGSRFAGWSDGNITVNTATIEYTALRNATLTANFIDAGNFQVSINYDEAMGTVTGAGEHHADNDVTVTATPNYGYHFVAWVNGEDSVFTPSYTFVMPTSEVELTAVFDYNQYTVTPVSGNAVMGSVSEGQTVNYLSTVAISATANYGYHFVSWTNADGNVIATTPNATVQALRDSVVTANFDYNQYTVTGTCHEAMGSVSGTATVNYLTPVTLTATAGTCYHFVGWSNGETTESITVEATADITVTALFEANVYSSEESVDVCDSYVWNGRTYTVGGNYSIDTVNANGCDSTATLVLTIRHSNSGTDVQNHCDTYTWIDGVTYTETPAEEPTFTLTNAAGCDSVVTLNLTVRHSTVGTDVQNHCDAYTWIDGVTYTETPAEAPTFTLPNAAGCDSVVTLDLTVRHSTLGDTAAVACNTFSWYEHIGLTESQEVQHTFVGGNQYGCDSTVTLHLTVNYSNTGDTAAVACDSFDWYEHTGLTESQTVQHTFLGGNAAGCDSTVTLALTVNYSNTGDTAAVACNNFDWYEHTGLTESQTVQHVFTNAAGCDSTVTLTLTVNYSNTGDTAAVACDSFEWYGVTYTESATPTHVFTNAAGCDSTVTLALTINNSQSVELTAVTACDSYEWNGETYTESGLLSYTTADVNGCDSTTTVMLTINNSQSVALAAETACDSYFWNGETYTESGELSYTTTDVNGCDSTTTLVLTVNHSDAVDTVAVACDSFTWNGVAYSETPAEAPTMTLTNAAGCDSVVTLLLTVNHSTTAVDTVTACNSFVWHGTEYTASTNEPTYTTVNAAGCDSTVTLHLTIEQCATTELTVCDSYTWPVSGETYTQSGEYIEGTDTLILTVNYSTAADEFVTACDSYTWNGVTYTEVPAEAPTMTLVNAVGCDSVVTLQLTLNSATTGVEELTACDSIEWHGAMYYASNNTATYTTVNAAGCDSTVTLNLTVNHSTTAVEEVTACNRYVWHGVEYTASTNEPTYTGTNAAGCDSVVTLHLTIEQCGTTTITACDSYTWMGNTYNASGEYVVGTDTLVLTINHSTVSDTIAEVCNSFTWHGVTYISTPAVAPTFVLENAVGCDSTVTLNLTVNQSTYGDTAATAYDSFEWHGNVYTESGVYTYTTTNADGCDSIVTLTLTVNHYDSVTVVLSVNDAAMGTTTPAAGTYRFYPGQTASATATANQGYLFAGWVVDGDTMSTDNTVSIDILPAMAGMTFNVVAAFEAEPSPYLTVNAAANDTNMGTVIGAGQYAEGSVVTLIAVSKPGHHFVSWSNGVTDSVYIFTVTCDTTLVAEFAPNVGIATADYSHISIYSADSKVYVKGAEGMTIYLYDVNGRCMARRANAADTETFAVETTGVILVKAGNAPAKRVIVVR